MLGRPIGDEIIITPEQIEKLAQFGATQHEMAHFLSISTSLIEERLQRPELRAAYDKGMATMKLSLRRHQFTLAEKGNATMLIWMGKQHLGQRDNLDAKLTGSGPNGELEVANISVSELLQRGIDRVVQRQGTEDSASGV